MRIGSSIDIHRLVENRKLIIGGVEIPSSKGSLAHSDGDVLIHAIVDALIGALGKGDIGEHFSDKDPKYQNINSTYFLECVKKMLSDEGYEILNIDSLVILEAPKLKDYKQKKGVRKSFYDLRRTRIPSVKKLFINIFSSLLPYRFFPKANPDHYVQSVRMPLSAYKSDGADPASE